VGGVEVFVDETKHSKYLLCAAVVPVHDLSSARQVMRELKPSNRRRLHMHDESSANRRRILAEFVRREPISEAHLFAAKLAGRPERAVRDACLRQLATDVAALGATRILVESCSQDNQDKRILTGTLARMDVLHRVRVDIDGPTAHELLWAADLVAWAYAAGGRECRSISRFITCTAWTEQRKGRATSQNVRAPGLASAALHCGYPSVAHLSLGGTTSPTTPDEALVRGVS